MYRFTRTATMKTMAVMPEALKFAAQIAAHLRKTYAYEMKVGVEMYGEPKIYWYGDTESLDEAAARQAKLAGDKKYWALIESGKGFWVEGSIRDRLVRLIE